jgi:hypothetical protein
VEATLAWVQDPLPGNEIHTDIWSGVLETTINGGTPPYAIHYQWKRLTDSALLANAPNLHQSNRSGNPPAPYRTWDRVISHDPRLANDWTNISGGTSEPYTIQPADAGQWLCCLVTISESGGAKVELLSEAVQIFAPITVTQSSLHPGQADEVVTLTFAGGPSPGGQTVSWGVDNDGNGEDVQNPINIVIGELTYDVAAALVAGVTDPDINATNNGAVVTLTPNPGDHFRSVTINIV